MTSQNLSPADLGWTNFFNSQLSAEERTNSCPVRVVAVHRDRIEVLGEGLRIQLPSQQTRSEEDCPTIGDWLLLDRGSRRPKRILNRNSLFERRAPGRGRKRQLIAANVDTLFIVSSCNQDFNAARIERYLVLARGAGVMPIVVLTKADLVEDPEAFADEARSLQPGLHVETINALDQESVDGVRAWCGRGQTVALLGSSGVGKSTLVNTLTGSTTISTRAIREDDDKGRHTTTARALHRLEQGGWLLDTPGMRELQLVYAARGVEEVFDDIMALAQQCRFTDCMHGTEPDCAIKAAVAAGTLDQKRIDRWRKLSAEEAYNSETIAERRARERGFGRLVRSTLKWERKRKWQ